MQRLYTLMFCLYIGNLQAAIFVVGDAGAECTHQSLQSALDAAKANGPEIDVIYATQAGSYLNTRAKIVDQSVWIVGGHTDCTRTTLGPENTDIHGSNEQADSVFEIYSLQAANPQHSVILQNLSISGGQPDELHGGGVELTSNDFDLTLIGLDIHHNSSSFGGGVRIDAGVDVEVVIANSIVAQNNASQDGGGISCTGGATIRMEGENVVALNSATSGGGIDADNCIIEREGALNLYQNLADNDGAGIYLRNGAAFRDLPDPESPENILHAHNNSAVSGGGAVLVHGGTSSLSLRAAVLEHNSSEFGAGIWLKNGASANWSGAIRPGECRQNTADWGGSCLYLSDSSSMSISGVEVSENQDTNLAAIEIFDGSFLFAESILAHHNDNVFRFAGNQTDAILRYITIADNAGISISVDNGALVDLNSSINQSGLQDFAIVDVTAFLNTTCVLSDVDQWLDTGDRNVHATTQFQDRAMKNYRLDDSQLLLRGPVGVSAIDYCDGPAPGSPDLDGKARAFDHPNSTNFHGAYDLGAYENHFDSDVIFTNGF